MAQKWFQKAGVQAGFVTGIFLVLAAVISGVVVFFKSQDSLPVAVNTPTLFVTSTPNMQPNPTPSLALVPSSTPSTRVVEAPRQQVATPPIKRDENAALAAQVMQLKEQLKDKERTLEVDRRLNQYLDQYIEQYSQIDLGDAPCEQAAIEQQRKARVLLDLIESLAKEVDRQDIINDFVRERRPVSIRFPQCR